MPSEEGYKKLFDIKRELDGIIERLETVIMDGGYDPEEEDPSGDSMVEKGPEGEKEYGGSKADRNRAIVVTLKKNLGGE